VNFKSIKFWEGEKKTRNQARHPIEIQGVEEHCALPVASVSFSNGFSHWRGFPQSQGEKNAFFFLFK
jgi:hypothetical protein